MAITLWHVTSRDKAARIRIEGFRDGPFRELRRLQGVYFADRPVWDAMSGGIPKGCVGIAAVSDLPPRQLEEYRVSEAGSLSEYAEWFIPAGIANGMELYFVSGDCLANESTV